MYADQAKTEICHVPATGATAVKTGDAVTAAIDWTTRYARMRMHTALHLLSAALPYPVTGGSIGDNEGRLDFDIPEAGLDKDEITEKIARMVKADADVRATWISDRRLVYGLADFARGLGDQEMHPMEMASFRKLFR